MTKLYYCGVGAWVWGSGGVGPRGGCLGTVGGKCDYVIFVVPCSLTFGIVGGGWLILTQWHYSCFQGTKPRDRTSVTWIRGHVWTCGVGLGLGSGRFLSEKTPRLGLVRESGAKWTMNLINRAVRSYFRNYGMIEVRVAWGAAWQKARVSTNTSFLPMGSNESLSKDWWWRWGSLTGAQLVCVIDIPHSQASSLLLLRNSRLKGRGGHEQPLWRACVCNMTEEKRENVLLGTGLIIISGDPSRKS